MKTKRLFLKLLLAVCFLMAVPPREAEAAPAETLDIANGNIEIKSDPTDQKDYISQTSDATGANPNKAVLTSNTYTINGIAGSPRTITITGPLNSTNNTVNLIFDNLRAAASSIQLKINNVNVNVTVQGAQGVLKGISGESAVEIEGTGQLHFYGSNESSITIMAGPGTQGTGSYGAVNALGTGTLNIHSGRVVLDAGSASQNLAFNGGSYGTLNIEGGTLECQRGPNTIGYGNGNLLQAGGTVIADGLANVDVIQEKIVGLAAGEYLFGLATTEGGKIDYSAVGNIQNPQDGIPIPTGWHGKYFSIQPKSDDAKVTQNYLYIPKRIKTTRPSGFSTTDETVSGKDDGTISRVDNTMQYISTDKATTSGTYNPADWIDCENNPALNGTTLTLAPGSYCLRYKYVESYNPKECAFASEPSTPITIKRADSLNAFLEYEFKSQEFGYKQADLSDTASITIQNSDVAGTVEITSITVSNDKAFRVLPGGSQYINYAESETTPYTDTTWKIQPKLDLNAGKYESDVIIKYNNRLGDPQPEIVIKDAVKFTVDPLDYAGDPLTVAPELESRNFNSITLKPIVIEGNTKEFEYGKVTNGGIVWQKDLKFTDLEADTEYKFVARFAAEGNYKASDPGPQAAFKTEKKASIVYSTKELSLIPNRKYQISIKGSEELFDDCTANANGLLDIRDKWFGNTIVIYDTVNKDSQELTIPDIGKAPTSPKGQAESFSSAGDGKILGVTTSMEYKLKGSNDDWVTCPAKTIENLAAGTYLVRTKAVDEGTGENKKYTFASQATEVVVARGNALSITPETFDLGKSPYKVLPTAKAIAFRNHDKTEDITIKSIALSDDSPFAILHKETDSAIVPAGKNNETFKIQPKPDLNVGTYTDEFVVTFEVGYNPDTDTSTGDGQIQAQSEGFNTDSPDTSGEKSAAIPITFTVEKGTQEAPPVPAEKSVKSTSITLETIPNSTVSGAKAQYSKDSGKTWQDSPTFNKLKADTEYYFVSRYAATDNYNESDISAGENAITTAEKDDDDDNDNSNKNVSSNANGSNGTNGTSGTNGTNGTNGTTGTNTTGTNGTNGTNNTNGTTSRGVSAARTGDLNNIQLWVTLMIGSYLSCYLIIRDRIKKARIK